MAADFYIKEGDSAPILTVTALDEDENVVDLTAAVSAAFYMIDPGDGTPKVDGRVANILSPTTDGKMEYVWQSDGSDTNDPGDYNGEFEVTWSDGTKTTFPNFRYLKIKVAKTIETTD